MRYAGDAGWIAKFWLEVHSAIIDCEEGGRQSVAGNLKHGPTFRQ